MVTKRMGRPLSRAKDLEPFTAHLSKKAKDRLKALAQVQRRHAYKILEEAFWTHWKSLPERDRVAAETMASALESVRDARSDTGRRSGR